MTTASQVGTLHHMHPEQVAFESLRELGRLKSGPAAVGFIDWVAIQAREDKVDHVLFVGPAGHAFHKLANLRWSSGPARVPSFSHLLGSQTSFALASMTPTSFDLSFLLSAAEGLSPVEVFERIDVPAPADHVLDDVGLGRNTALSPDLLEQMRDFLQAWRWEILKICQQNRRGLFRHLLDLGVHAGHRVAIVEVGWDGGTQDAFEKALHGVMSLKVVGYNFCLSDSSDCLRRRDNLRMRALIDAHTVPMSVLRSLCDKRVICEILLASLPNRVIGYRDNHQGIVSVEDKGRAAIDGLAAIAAEIEAGMFEIATSEDRLETPINIAPGIVQRAMPLIEFVARDIWAESALLKQIKNFDPWTSSRNRDVWLRPL